MKIFMYHVNFPEESKMIMKKNQIKTKKKLKTQKELSCV